MWLWWSFSAAFLFAVVTHIDKYLLGKFFKGGTTRSILIFSALAGIPVSLVIGLVNPGVFGIDFLKAILIIFNGMVYLLSLWPYFEALNRDEASRVSPLFEMVGVISLISGGLFLHESINFKQLLGAFLIVAGGIGILVEIKKGKGFTFKKDVFWLMLLAAFLTAVNGLIFKSVAEVGSLWVTMFWEYIGFSLFAVVVLVFSRTFREQFIKVFKKNKGTVIGINVVNALIATGAKICFHIASLSTMVAIAFWVMDGIQPVIVLVLGSVITRFLPGITKEDISLRALIHKGGFIALMAGGMYLLI